MNQQTVLCSHQVLRLVLEQKLASHTCEHNPLQRRCSTQRDIDFVCVNVACCQDQAAAGVLKALLALQTASWPVQEQRRVCSSSLLHLLSSIWKKLQTATACLQAYSCCEQEIEQVWATGTRGLQQKAQATSHSGGMQYLCICPVGLLAPAHARMDTPSACAGQSASSANAILHL